MHVSDLRPSAWLSNEVEVKSVTVCDGEVHCHVLMYSTSKNLSAAELCDQFGARHAEPAEDLFTRPNGGGATMRFAQLTFGPDDTVLVA